jgi:hypothetical protein
VREKPLHTFPGHAPAFELHGAVNARLNRDLLEPGIAKHFDNQFQVFLP